MDLLLITTVSFSCAIFCSLQMDSDKVETSHITTDDSQLVLEFTYFSVPTSKTTTYGLNHWYFLLSANI